MERGGMFMVERKYRVFNGEATQPISISALIQAANRFHCDIYMEVGAKQFNMKDYDECQRGVQNVNKICVVYFNGADEQEAEGRFQTLFGGYARAV